MKTKVYLAGSLFSEAEQNQRRREGTIFRKLLGTQDYELFNPIEQPFNEDKGALPSPQSIYRGDINAVRSSDVVIADISNQSDPGVFYEIAVAHELGIRVIAVNSDLRIATANEYALPSWGMNHFILGALLENDSIIVSCFEDAVKMLVEAD